MAIIDGPKGSGAFALAQHIANQTDLIMIDDSQLPFGAK
jgi:cytidylate kinase